MFWYVSFRLNAVCQLLIVFIIFSSCPMNISHCFKSIQISITLINIGLNAQLIKQGIPRFPVKRYSGREILVESLKLGKHVIFSKPFPVI